MNKKSQNHIDCGTALEWIHLLLDKELPPLDQQKLQAHLQSCINCSAAFRELSLIENAHGVLDRSLDAVSAGYFEELPERVMARLARAEKPAIRAFSLPKPQLPKWQMPAGWQQLILGRGKYVLAFAAVMLLTFVITRQLRQDFFSAAVKPESSPQSAAQPMPTQSDEPAQRDLSEAKKDLLSIEAESQDAAREPLPAQTDEQSHRAPSEARKDPVGSESESQSVTQALLRTPPPPTPTEESQSIRTVQSKVALESGQEAADQKEQATQPALGTAPEFAQFERGDTAGGRASELSSVDALGKQRAPSPQSTAGAEAPRRTSAKMLTPTDREPAGRASPSGYIAAQMPVADFQQTATQARQAASEQNRRKIWLEFLKTKPDSAHYLLAAAEIGRSFAAEIDSASTRSQIEEALQFYDRMAKEKVLSTSGHQETFVRERGRLEGLLRWKKMR